MLDEELLDMADKTIMFAVSSPEDIGLIEADKVARIAAALGAQLELFHCLFDSEVAHPGPFAFASAEQPIQRLVSMAHRRLEHIAGRLRADGLRVRTSIRWDYPAYQGITRQVLRHRPALLIARSSRRGRTERLLLSHTDWKLIESCPCPLLLLKTHDPYAEPLVIAAVDPEHAHDEPAALDDRILDSAGRVAAALSGKLEIFFARTPWEEAIRMDPELRDLPEYRDEEFHRAYLSRVEGKVQELAERHHVMREQVHIADGHAADSLPNYAKQRGADIVVIGAVSRSRLRRALIGQTAERVIDALCCDALIIKPPGFRTPVRRQSTHHVVAGTLRTRLRS